MFVFNMLNDFIKRLDQVASWVGALHGMSTPCPVWWP